MKQAVKFTFDTHFGDESGRPAAKAQSSPVFTEADMEAARMEGFAAGQAQGRCDAEAEADRQLGNAMAQLSQSAASLLAALDSHISSTKREASELALEVARKLAPALIAAQPEAEIEALLRNCLAHLNREPHILLRVSTSLVDRMKETVDRMAMERGLTGRIILLGEPAMTEGDCVVEWADGGVARNREEIEHEIVEIITRHIETMKAGRDNSLAMPEPREAGRDER
ncbi:MAG: flagellar assembly protein FliH [Alphaproteobacteria bacterium HGW-Alphaproteobacteria-12]|nr:MAG: flagellar assembly protein FliH [Alphaproteobacteria bacterium HGW-Alphaproteobacteria-12]